MINDRIQKIVDELFSGNVSAFCRAVNVKQPTMNTILGERKSKPSFEVISNIINAESLMINADWLISGKGKMRVSENLRYYEVKMVDPNFAEVIKIPVKAKAGYLNGYNDETFLKEMPVVLVQVDQTFHGRYRCFEVEGDSMNDGTLKSICDGDTVLCREVKRDLWCYKLHYNQWMFVINHVDGLLIKQIVDHDIEKGTITCHSLNPIYGEDFTLNLNEVRELYNVIKITDRNLKL